MKKQMISLAMAGILAVGGIALVGVNENVLAKATADERQGRPALHWNVGKTVTIGLGEQLPDVCEELGNSALAFHELLSTNSKPKLDITTANPTGANIGRCQVMIQEDMTGDFLQNSKGETRKYLNVVVRKAPKSIKWVKKKITIKVGETVSRPKIKLSKGSASYHIDTSCSNSKVATMKGGKITGLSKGTAKITVKTYNGKKATLKVVVK